jgi:hypothetical protein
MVPQEGIKKVREMCNKKKKKTVNASVLPFPAKNPTVGGSWAILAMYETPSIVRPNPPHKKSPHSSLNIVRTMGEGDEEERRRDVRIIPLHCYNKHAKKSFN